MHKLCNDLSLEDQIWIAAFFDGEGSTSLTKKYWNGFYSGKYISASIGQSEREVLDWIQEVTGIGAVYPDRSKKHHFKWVVSGMVAVSFLEAIEGWIRTKNHKEAIEHVLAYYESRNSCVRFY